MNYPALNGEDFARDQSKQARKAHRSDVRAHLGTSSDPAPEIRQALLAADSLKQIVDAASGGRYGLAVYDFRTQTHRPVAEALAEVQEQIHRNRVERNLPV
jgi:hypothetical protein